MEGLIIKSIKGDVNAYRQLIDLVSDELYRIALIRLGNIDDVNDVIQETLFKAYKNLHNLKQKEYFRTWIVKILINECNNLFIRQKKEYETINKFINLKDYSYAENSTEKVDNKIDFYLMLNSLNVDEKTVIILYYKYKYKTGEIADILNENINTIKSRLTRAKLKIQKEMKGGNSDESGK